VFLAMGLLLAGAFQFFISMKIMPKGALITDSKAVMKAMLAPENVNMARISQVLSTFALMFLPAIIWSFICNGKNMIWLGFSKHINPTQVFIGFVIIFVTAIAVGPLADISKAIVAHLPGIDATAKKLENLYTEQALALSNLKNVPEFLVGLVIMALLPAVFEEMFFRGMMQNLLVRWLKMPIVAILITSFIFSLIHSSIYLFLTRMALGFVLGYMYYTTKNIWVNIIAHFLNNAFALTALFMVRNTPTKNDLDKLEPHVHWSVAIAAVIGVVMLFKLLQKHSVQNKALIEQNENALIQQSII
jgi:membrane protease YdiL (CAAX protease family)